jgi:hypothetical protein
MTFLMRAASTERELLCVFFGRKFRHRDNVLLLHTKFLGRSSNAMPVQEFFKRSTKAYTAVLSTKPI